MKKWMQIVIAVSMVFTAKQVVAVPVVDTVYILGSGYYNGTAESTIATSYLSGIYYFDDSHLDLEVGSRYQWFRGEDSIVGASDIRYQLSYEDLGQDLYFEVTPRDAEGNVGLTVRSAAFPVVASDVEDIILSNMENHISNETYSFMNVSGIAEATPQVDLSLSGGKKTAVYIYGDLDLRGLGSVVLDISGGTLDIYGKLFVDDSLQLIVDESANFYVHSGMELRSGAALDLDGHLHITGDVNIQSDVSIDVKVNTQLDVQGDLNLGDHATVVIDGDLNVAGDLDLGEGSTLIINKNQSVIEVGGNLLNEGSCVTGVGTLNVAGVVASEDCLSVGGNYEVLPIELLSFAARIVDGHIQLSWQTASETDNDFFTLERSLDGRSFQEVCVLSGAGNSNVLNSYQFIEYPEASGLYYYRLKQTDYDGNFSYSAVISVPYFVEEMLESARIWVNQQGIQINFDQWVNQVDVQLVQMTGRVALQQHLGGEARFCIPTYTLNPGLYLVILSVGDQLMKTEKIYLH